MGILVFRRLPSEVPVIRGRVGPPAVAVVLVRVVVGVEVTHRVPEPPVLLRPPLLHLHLHPDLPV